MVNNCISPTPPKAMLSPQYVKAPKAFTGLKQHCSMGEEEGGREWVKNTVGMTNCPIFKVWTGEIPCFIHISFRGANVMFLVPLT